MIQISCRTQDTNIRQVYQESWCQKLQLIHHPLCFQNLRIRSTYHTNSQSVRFLRPNPSTRKPIHSPLCLISLITELCQGNSDVSEKCLLCRLYKRTNFPSCKKYFLEKFQNLVLIPSKFLTRYTLVFFSSLVTSKLRQKINFGGT